MSTFTVTAIVVFVMAIIAATAITVSSRRKKKRIVAERKRIADAARQRIQVEREGHYGEKARRARRRASAPAPRHGFRTDGPSRQVDSYSGYDPTALIATGILVNGMNDNGSRNDSPSYDPSPSPSYDSGSSSSSYDSGSSSSSDSGGGFSGGDSGSF